MHWVLVSIMEIVWWGGGIIKCMYVGVKQRISVGYLNMA